MKKILLLLITAICITLLTPNRSLVDVNIRKGEVWNEQTLIAPFDIPILKNSASIEAERQAVISNFQPVLRIDTTVSNRKINSLAELLRERSFPQAIVDKVVTLLTQASAVGIIQTNDAVKYNDKYIRICDEFNAIKSIPANELYTSEQLVDMVRQLGVDFPALLNYIQPNLSYNEKLNNSIRENELNNISTTRSMIRAGETIVSKGQVIDEQSLQIIKSFLQQHEVNVGMNQGFYSLLIGRFLLVLIILIVNYQFFSSFAHNYFGKNFRSLVFVMMLYVIMAALMAIAVQLKGVSPYIVPLPVVAIYLMNYFNMRVAILGNITVAIICALFVRIPFDFFVINFVGGMAAIFMMRHHYHRYNLFRAIGVILISQVITFISVALIRDADISAVDYSKLIWFVVNIFLILGFYQAVYLIERIFGFVSDVTLLELCDTNQPLLLELAERAPGTFQHSVQVANLAEAAANEIGVNPLLARTGALYQDIGKMQNPVYFTENQSANYNPHDELESDESVDHIKKHVSDGVTTATKKRLPKQIIDFIEGHHGTSKMYYFFAKEKDANGGVVDESAFCYDGPKPSSKEVTICMMADAVEAASRSLKSYDSESLNELVNKIIDTQISEKQFSESEISFHEVEKIKTVFRTKLNNIYHVRVEYPERK